MIHDIIHENVGDVPRLEQAPSVVTVKPTIQKLLTHPVPDCKWSSDYIFYEDGIMIQPKDDNVIIKLKLVHGSKTSYSGTQSNPACYIEEWRKPVPSQVDLEAALQRLDKHDLIYSGMEENAWSKYTLQCGNIVARNSTKNVTFVFDCKFNIIDIYNLDNGRLCGCSGQNVIYTKESSSGDGWDVIVTDHTDVHTLSHSVGNDWVSVGTHQPSGWMVVVAWKCRYMDIYDDNLNLVRRVELQFDVNMVDAVCVINEFIFIRESRSWVHVLNWSGVELTQIEVGDYVEGIGATRDGQLQVVTDDNKLHLFNVVCTN